MQNEGCYSKKTCTSLSCQMQFFSHNIQSSTRMANLRQKLNLTFAEALTQTKTKNAFEFIISIKGRVIKGNQRKDIHMVCIIALPIR